MVRLWISWSDEWSGYLQTFMQFMSSLLYFFPYSHDSNFAHIIVTLILILMMISGHNFAHAMTSWAVMATTAQLSWHVQNCNLIVSYSSCNSKIYIFLQDLDYELINYICENIPYSFNEQMLTTLSTGVLLLVWLVSTYSRRSLTFICSVKRQCQSGHSAATL